MLRLVAVAAFTATLALPAYAEPGFVHPASVRSGVAFSGLVPGAACEFPVHPAVDTGSIAPEGPAMTLTARMLQAIRIDTEASIH